MDCAPEREYASDVCVELDVLLLLELEQIVEIVGTVAHREGMVLRRILRIVVSDRHPVSFVRRDPVRREIIVRDIRMESLFGEGFVET